MTKRTHRATGKPPMIDPRDAALETELMREFQRRWPGRTFLDYLESKAKMRRRFLLEDRRRALWRRLRMVTTGGAIEIGQRLVGALIWTLSRPDLLDDKRPSQRPLDAIRDWIWLLLLVVLFVVGILMGGIR